MIEFSSKTNVYLCCEAVDMRKGFDGLSGEVKRLIGTDPYSGHLFVFRGKSGNLIKIIFWDGTGACMFTKRLEAGRFVWPPLKDGAFQLTVSQLRLLLEGMDWRRTIASAIHAPRYV